MKFPIIFFLTIISFFNGAFSVDDHSLIKPSWPEQRGPKEYFNFFDSQLESAIRSISRGKIIEIGCGEGNFLKEVRRNNIVSPEVELLCITATHVLHHQYLTEHSIALVYGFVPNNDQFLKDNIESAGIVIDIFAANTYADNPLNSLIYETMLLEPKGELFSISSMIPGALDETAFGNHATRNRIQEFFARELGVELTFTVKNVPSAVMPGTFVQDLIIHAKRFNDMSFTVQKYRDVIQKSEIEIGVPRVKSLWKQYEGGFAITTKEYTL